MYDANRSGVPLEFYHAYKIVFLCEIIGGQARPSNETLAVDFFSFDDLPPLSAERTNERHLPRCSPIFVIAIVRSLLTDVPQPCGPPSNVFLAPIPFKYARLRRSGGFASTI